jgi:catechol 2,3-dioxygenase-like lactoylglutathione lyase family enzyme
LGEDSRLGSGVGIEWVSLSVSNLERSLDFYLGVLGLKRVDLTGNAVVLGTSLGKPLIILREKLGAQPKPPETAVGYITMPYSCPAEGS